MSLGEAIDCMQAAWAQGADSPRVYVKDWHLVRQERQKAADARPDAVARLALPYETPDVFLDDWMNNGVITTSKWAPAPTADAAPIPAPVPDDFQFIYAGMPGTRTPLHRDVYTSYSWSTNLVGRKRWVLYPPSLADRIHAWLNPDRAIELDAASGKARKAPRMSEAEVEALRADMERCRVVVVQEEGETIFVPSNWFHQVENLHEGEGSRREEVRVKSEDNDAVPDEPLQSTSTPRSRGAGTISLNHNWCNSVNLPSMYAAMKRGMQEVEVALEDVRDMLMEQGRGQEAGADAGAAPLPQHWQQEFLSLVQLVSRSDAGWDWAQFWAMVASWLCPTDSKARSCPPHLHPDVQEFVLPRVGAMVEDFLTRGPGGPEFADAWKHGWLDEGVRESVKVCAQAAGIRCEGNDSQR